MNYVNCPICNGVGIIKESEIPMAVALEYAEEHLDKIETQMQRIIHLESALRKSVDFLSLVDQQDLLEVITDHVDGSAYNNTAALQEELGELPQIVDLIVSLGIKPTPRYTGP